MPRTVKQPERPTHRTVVLLRRSEKLKLERIASREKISSGEVIRRFIGGSETFSSEEEKVIEAALKIMSEAIAEANQSMEKTIARLDELHLDLKQREVR